MKEVGVFRVSSLYIKLASRVLRTASSTRVSFLGPLPVKMCGSGFEVGYLFSGSGRPR